MRSLRAAAYLSIALAGYAAPADAQAVFTERNISVEGPYGIPPFTGLRSETT
jgi:hypothetical protein